MFINDQMVAGSPEFYCWLRTEVAAFFGYENFAAAVIFRPAQEVNDAKRMLCGA